MEIPFGGNMQLGTRNKSNFDELCQKIVRSKIEKNCNLSLKEKLLVGKNDYKN